MKHTFPPGSLGILFFRLNLVSLQKCYPNHWHFLLKLISSFWNRRTFFKKMIHCPRFSLRMIKITKFPAMEHKEQCLHRSIDVQLVLFDQFISYTTQWPCSTIPWGWGRVICNVYMYGGWLPLGNIFDNNSWEQMHQKVPPVMSNKAPCKDTMDDHWCHMLMIHGGTSTTGGSIYPIQTNEIIALWQVSFLSS